jgi:hypothetical protein
MKTTKLAALSFLLIGAAIGPEAFAQTAAPTPPTNTTTPAPQAQRPMRPNRSVEISEARPGVWVNGKPDKPIFSGSMPIYPEAYDYMPAKTP